jgi:hypothetical protein
MRIRLQAIFLAVLALPLLAAASAGATMVGIYRNDMGSTAKRAQLVKLAGGTCTRGGSESALRILVGKGTGDCSYRTPVIGRDLEIGATERLLSGTPKSLQSKAYLALDLRAGGGAKYQLLVFPLQRKVQLLKQPAGGGAPEYLAIDKNEQAVLGLNKPNALRLRAINVTSGPEKGHCELFAYLGSTLVAEATDEASGELAGRASAVSVGATKSANGVLASIDDVVVRVPVSF